MVLALSAAAFVGGIIQTVTGFGAGVLILIALTNYYNMLVAPAINTSICLGLSAMLVYKYRKHLSAKIIALPILGYIPSSVLAIFVSSNLDLNILAAAFGIFLVGLSIYFFFFERKIHITPTPFAALICGVFGGLCSGLFGLGGPTLSLYLVTVSKDHSEYIANIQTSFFLANMANMITRAARGIYTAELLPISLVGLVSVFCGISVGGKIVKGISKEQSKKIIYGFVGFFGAWTFLQNI